MKTEVKSSYSEPPYEKIIKLPQVCEITSLSKSSIYEKMAKGEFPKSVSISNRCVGWLLSEVNTFIQERVAESRKEQSNA